MFDDFISFAPVVINFPLRKNQLHEMRKAGKPLRYAMELGEYCFTPDFKLCLDEVKLSLDLMGEVHDADVMIPDISLHMKEVRLFNQTIKDSYQRISTRQLRSSVMHLRAQRRELYAELCQKLNMWKENDFKSRIQLAMNSTISST
jgi:CHAD domain-containing protein